MTALQVAKKAVTAAGYLSRGEQSQEVRNLHVEALLETANIKSDVLPFAAGDALCFAFGGPSPLINVVFPLQVFQREWVLTVLAEIAILRAAPMQKCPSQEYRCRVA